METKFGKWIESRGFPVTVNAVVILALGYMALRDANALDWGLHRSLYGPDSSACRSASEPTARWWCCTWKRRKKRQAVLHKTAAARYPRHGLHVQIG